MSLLCILSIIRSIFQKKKSLDGLGSFCIWVAMCTAKYPTDFLYLISRTDFVNQSLKLLTICFFNKVYILFLFVILKCHMVADTNPQYVAIVLSDHSWKQHNYPNGDLTFHWVLMDCFLSTFLIKKKKKSVKCYCQSWLCISCLGMEKSSGQNQAIYQLSARHPEWWRLDSHRGAWKYLWW